MTDDVPDWISNKRVRSVRGLNFRPPRREHAEPLSIGYLTDAFAELGTVIVAHELDGLDVWIVRVLRQTPYRFLELVLYEHMGEWHCSSVRHLK